MLSCSPNWTESSLLEDSFFLVIEFRCISVRELRFFAVAARKHTALLRWSLSVAWHAIRKMHSEKLRTSQPYDHWHQQKCQFIALVAVKLCYIEIADNLASLYGGKKYVAFSGHELIKTEILCYIENFVILRFNSILSHWVVWKVSSSTFSTYTHSSWEDNNILCIHTRLAQTCSKLKHMLARAEPIYLWLEPVHLLQCQRSRYH